VLLVVWLLDLRKGVGAALLGFAVAPVLPPWAKKGYALGAASDYVIGLEVMATVASIIVIPVMIWIVNGVFEVQTAVDPWSVELMLLVTIGLPLAVGMGLGRLRPGSAPRLAFLVDRVGSVVLLIGGVVLLVARWRDILAVMGRGTIVVSLAIIGFGLLMGHLIGGPDPGKRGALASANVSRHPGVALLLGSSAFPEHVPAVTWLPAEMDGVSAVVAATLDASGALLQANTGFLRLLAPPAPGVSATELKDWFVQPGLAALKGAVANAADHVYSGLMTVGTEQGLTRTLKARVWRAGDLWHVLAEHDIDELERVCATVLQLNQEYAFAQARLAQLNIHLKQREAQILAASLSDPLTGVGNRRRLEQALPLELSRAKRSGESLSAIMCDIDHFKQVNDQFGHEVGDSVLIGISHILLSQMRPTDIVTRFGGEEFVVLMPNTGIVSAMEAAERLRAIVQIFRIAPLVDPVTASYGVAELQPDEQAASLLKRIDSAMYVAKLSGRNRVERG
jgi:diguanylate cyclase (GGDEF)-like protein